MKKIIVLMVLIGGIAFGQEAKTPATWKDWTDCGTKIATASASNQYMAAYLIYVKQAKIAEELKRPDLVAWANNNAAYMIIRHYQEGKAGVAVLEIAVKHLRASLDNPAIVPECKTKADMNLNYCNYHLNLKKGEK